ncbi:helix-turn-helix domain-containing protein [Simkania sp.]|uniref:helix-turn-helix domain-containing protein n=1 Tax=Simkania sp. TaxID=34094 RepID=UPI003B523CA2
MKEYLFKRNIPPKKFASDLRISVSYLYQLLRGERKPSLELAQKIEAYTEGEVTALQLLGIVQELEGQTLAERYEKRLSNLEETIGKIQDTLEQMEWRISELEP